jgi:hypothetical protein
MTNIDIVQKYIFKILQPSIPYSLFIFGLHLYLDRKMLSIDNLKKFMPKDYDELFREDSIIFVLFGIIQSFITFNVDFMSNIFNALSIPYFILFIYFRAIGHIKNNSDYRMRSIRAIYNLVLWDGLILYSLNETYLTNFADQLTVYYGYPFYGLFMFIVIIPLYFLQSIIEVVMKERYLFLEKKRYPSRYS